MGIFDTFKNMTFVGPGMAPVYHTPLSKEELAEGQEARFTRSIIDSYYDGVKGLSKNDRAEWEKRYSAEIQGKTEEEKDNIFRNSVFTMLFKDSNNPEHQKIWNDRKNYSILDRDRLVSLEISNRYDVATNDPYKRGFAYGDDYFKKSDEEKQLIDEDQKKKDEEGNVIARGRGFSNRPLIDVHQKALETIEEDSKDSLNIIKANLNSLDSNEKQRYLDEFDKLSAESSNYYKEYIGTDKLNLNDEKKLELLAEFMALQEYAGNNIAFKILNRKYQDMVASKQGLLEKTWNTGAQFVDSAAGMIIRAGGMLGALTTLGKDKDESYWENVIDNAVTRYGDRVATTQSWKPEEQEHLEELGLSDNPILNTVKQQESLISTNTPFELLGQYGFTTASTILSMGGSSALNFITKGGSLASKAAVAGRTASSAKKALDLSKVGVSFKKYANLGIAAGVGTVEGGMNAAQTRKATLDNFTRDIESRYSRFDEDPTKIAKMVSNNPEGAVKVLKEFGLDNVFGVELEPDNNGKYSEEVIDNISRLLEESPTLLNKVAEGNIKEEMAVAEDAAAKAMKVNFVGNSFINGLMNVTLKASLQAPSVQKAISKTTLGKALTGNPWDKKGVKILDATGKPKAQAIKYTKAQAVKNRVKEALGEGFEEYTQELSDAFATGYSTSEYDAYLQNKFGGGTTEDALAGDFITHFGSGLVHMSEAAVSKEAIKSFLYGGLSTFLGGYNVNANALNGTRGEATRQKGESRWEYLSRRSPIEWRSGLSPLWNTTEQKRVNEQRERLAKEMNDFFDRAETQEGIFNVINTSNWVTQLEEAASNKDEKALRDKKLGLMFSNIIALNSTEGSGYYDSVMEGLKARAAFDEENLQDENSEEYKTVQQYKQEIQNRSSEISDEEALETIKSNASKMLDIIEKTKKETEAIEKLHGRDLDKDVKEGLVFQRIATQDYKKRMDSLEEEIAEVRNSLLENPESSSRSNLGKRGKSLLANYQSIDKANEEAARLEDVIEQNKPLIAELKDMVKYYSGDNKLIHSIMLQQLKSADSEVKHKLAELNKQIKEYSKEESQFTDEEGNVTTTAPILTALDILELNAEDRAMMLDPSNLSNFSEEQKAEINKVNELGASIYTDFSNKIQDSGRLSISYTMGLQEQLEMVRNPQFFIQKAQQLKTKAQKRLLKEQYRYLVDDEYSTSSNITQDWIDEVESLLGKDALTREAITELFNESNSKRYELYTAYKNANKDLHDHLNNNKNEVYNKLDEDKKFLFDRILEYLESINMPYYDGETTNNPLDNVRNINKTLEQIGLKNPETGNYSIIEWLKENTYVDTEGLSIDDVASTYKDVMSAFNDYTQDQERRNAPVVSDNTSDEQSDTYEDTDAKTEEEKKKETPLNTQPREGNTGVSSLLSMGFSSLDELNESERRVQEQENQSEPQNTPENTSEEESKSAPHNSNKSVEAALEIANNKITNNKNSSKEDKERALDVLKDLAVEEYDSLEDFTTAVNRKANELNISNDDSNGNDKIALLLSSSVSQLDESTVKEYNKNRNTQNNSEDQVNRKGQYMSSVNILTERSKNPNSVVVKYYDQHNIEEALVETQLNSGTKVYFITDPALTAAFSSEKEGYNKENDLPIVAVIESKKGTIQIGDKKYQPIGVMPSNSTDPNYNYRGVDYLIPIRERAQQNTTTGLVLDEDGKPYTTTSYGQPQWGNLDVKNKTGEAVVQTREGNREVIQVGLSDLKDSNLSEKEKKAKAKKSFLAGLTKETKVVRGHNVVQLEYQQQHNKEGEKPNPIYIFTKYINETSNKDGETFDVVARKEDNKAIVNFNSRTRKGTNALFDFFTGENREKLLAFKGKDNLTEKDRTELSDLSSTLSKKLTNYLSLPGGWSYKITYNKNSDKYITISISNNLYSESIPLIDINPSNISEENVEEVLAIKSTFLKNLILDEEGKVRMTGRDQNISFVKWGVSYNFEEGTDLSKEDMGAVYDDNILIANTSSFKYSLEYVKLRPLPSKSGATTVNPPTNTTVANSSNATPSTPVNSIVGPGRATTGNTIVDTDSGTVIGSDPEVAEKAQEAQERKSNESAISAAKKRASEIMKKIIEDSKKVRLSSDRKNYENSSGRKNARVTSIIKAAKGSKKATPSSRPNPAPLIGNSVDEFVRDIFLGKVYRNQEGKWETTVRDKDTNTESTTTAIDTVYPNANVKQLNAFADQVQKAKETLESLGYTISSEYINARGDLEVVDNNDELQLISTSGVLDLLSYDDNGDFHIIDMKTTLSGVTEDEKIEYSRQLSIYAKFLEDTYGIKVKSIQVMPIQVSWEVPNSTTNIEYSESTTTPNQVMVKDLATQKEHTYKNAKPTLQELIPLERVKVELDWNSLSDEEKALARPANPTPVATEKFTPTAPISLEVDEGINYGGDSFGNDVFRQSEVSIPNNSEEMSQSLHENPNPRYAWDTLDSETKTHLKARGYNKKSWKAMSEEERACILNCM